MLRIKKIFLFSVVLLKLSNLFGQEQLGLRLENYSGVSGILLNPASNATSKLGWDVNIIGVGAFFGNDIGYIENATVGSAANNAATIGPNPELGYKSNIQATLLLNAYKSTNPKFVSTSVQIMGPSFVINLASGHSFGLFTQVRAMGGSHGLPRLANPYEYEKLKKGDVYDIDPFKISGMAWSEIGFNYGYRFGDESEGGLAFGVNVKYLNGFQAGYGNVLPGTRAQSVTGDSFRFELARIEAGFTTNYMDKNTVSKSNGSGFGIDIGAVMTIPGDEERPYEWRFGASVMDMGSVNFTQNAEVQQITLKEPFVFDKNDYQNLDPKDPRADAIQRFSQKAFGSPLATLKSKTFSMGLPSALQVSADYSFTKNLFVNATLLQALPVGETVLVRDNLLAVTPRFESRWLSASLPISLLNWGQMRMGLATRLAFLTIGTEDLLSLISSSKLTGTDIYVALKVNPFRVGKLSGGNGGGRRRGGKVQCYRF